MIDQPPLWDEEDKRETPWPVEGTNGQPQGEAPLSGHPRRPIKIGRHAPRREDRRFDKTALHYDSSGRTISHADYIAHCEKYDYAWRSIARGDRILDIGCGTDLPLAMAITKSMSVATGLVHHGGGWVGVDLNRVKATKISWATAIGEIDATDPANWPRMVPREDAVNRWSFGEYTKVVCLEVIEHMGVEDGQRLLSTIREALVPGGQAILSTPVYDGKGMARNHVHEYGIAELRDTIHNADLKIVRRLGTFTAEPALRRWLKVHRPDWLALYDEAREFHSAGYMSGVLAPMLPDLARNNVWVLERPS